MKLPRPDLLKTAPPMAGNLALTGRRRFLASFALAPLAAAALTACARKGNWAEGMRPIIWDRDPCAHCGMVISDRRFAAEICGGPRGDAFKFDDIGCAIAWQRDKARDVAWSADPATRIWVADVASQGEDPAWLDARAARYLPGKTSPMGYNFGATAQPQTGAVDFQTLRQQVLARG